MNQKKVAPPQKLEKVPSKQNDKDKPVDEVNMMF